MVSVDEKPSSSWTGKPEPAGRRGRERSTGSKQEGAGKDLSQCESKQHLGELSFAFPVVPRVCMNLATLSAPLIDS